MDQYSGSSYQDLLNNSIVSADVINLTGNDPSSVPYINGAQQLADYVFTNGQLLMGVTGGDPTPGNLTPGSNVSITNGPGSIAVGLTGIIPIANGGTNSGTALFGGHLMVSNAGEIIEGTSSFNPMFGTVKVSNLIDTGLTPSELVSTDGSSQLHSVTITNAHGCATSFSGSTLNCTMTQDLTASGQPTFANLIDSGLTHSSLVASDVTSQLQSVIITNSNGCLTSFTGSTLTASMTQDLSTIGFPLFSAMTLNGTSNQLVLQNGSSNTITLNMSSPPASSRVYSMPLAGADADFIVSEAVSGSTINGVRTFGSAPIFGYATGNSIAVLDSSRALQSRTLSDGELLIGSTGTAPISATLTGTFDQIDVTNGSGSITLSLPSILVFGTTTIGASGSSTIWTNTGSSNAIIQDNTGKIFTSFNELDDGAGAFQAVKVTVGTSLFLPTLTGTPTNLNYYEEFTHSTTVIGPWTVPIAISIQMTRIGRIVTALTTSDTTGTFSFSAQAQLNAALPVRFRPAGHLRLYTLVEDASASVDSHCDLPTSGFMSWSVGPSGANFSAGVATIYAFSYSWSV